jgi:uncharacterized protein YpmB
MNRNLIIIISIVSVVIIAVLIYLYKKKQIKAEEFKAEQVKLNNGMQLMGAHKPFMDRNEDGTLTEKVYLNGVDGIIRLKPTSEVKYVLPGQGKG